MYIFVLLLLVCEHASSFVTTPKSFPLTTSLQAGTGNDFAKIKRAVSFPFKALIGASQLAKETAYGASDGISGIVNPKKVSPMITAITGSTEKQKVYSFSIPTD